MADRILLEHIRRCLFEVVAANADDPIVVERIVVELRNLLAGRGESLVHVNVGIDEPG